MRLLNKRNDKGFSLVEVMIATLVLGVGILAVSKMQGSLIKSGSDANNRSTAAILAQKKVDDLRKFIHLRKDTDDAAETWTAVISPASMAFQHIEANKGGSIASGAQTIGSQEYTLTWDVEDYYYSATNSPATTTNAAGATLPNFKQISVNVSWTSASGTESISIDSIINAYAPSSTVLAGSSSFGGQSPTASYTPGEAPDVLAIDLLNGNMRESSEINPQISNKEHSTEVFFETVTYNSNNEVISRDTNLLLACDCKSAYSYTEERTVGKVIWNATSGLLENISYTVSSDGTASIINDSGGDAASISKHCITCCRDGRDGNGVGSHGSGDEFKEVCRTKLVDGIFRVFTPWKMISFNVIPASFFDDGFTGMTAAKQLVNSKDFANYYVTLTRGIYSIATTEAELTAYSTIDSIFSTHVNNFYDADAAHTTITLAGPSTLRQMQARAVYLDPLPSNIYNQTTLDGGGNPIYYSATNVPRDRIPFTELNVTLLAGWAPDETDLSFEPTSNDYTFDETSKTDPGGHDKYPGSGTYEPTAANDRCVNSGYGGASDLTRNCVTNQTLVSDGTYSRGTVKARYTGVQKITAGINISNNGQANVIRTVTNGVDETTTITSLQLIIQGYAP